MTKFEKVWLLLNTPLWEERRSKDLVPRCGTYILPFPDGVIQYEYILDVNIPTEKPPSIQHPNDSLLKIPDFL